MTQIFSKFRKQKNTETKKEENLLTKLPYDLADLVPNTHFVFRKALLETIDISSPFVYENTNPFNQVTMCQIFFDKLYWIYLKHLTTKITDFRLPNSGYSCDEDERPYIIYDEYKRMPKKYRGIFSNINPIIWYVLNEHAEPHNICIVKPKDKKKMESLLLQAAKLVVKETDPESELTPQYWFVKDDSPLANYVTKEQVDAIKKQYDIFVELDKITQFGFKYEFAHSGEKNKKRHGARDIYNEYQNELTQKNRFWRAQQEITTAKMKREMELDTAQKIAKNAELKYKEIYQSIIDNAKKQISR